jgi:hypothetical protein
MTGEQLSAGPSKPAISGGNIDNGEAKDNASVAKLDEIRQSMKDKDSATG